MKELIEACADYLATYNQVPGADLKKDLTDFINAWVNTSDELQTSLDDRFYAYIDFRFSKGSLIANTAEKGWEDFKEKYSTYKLIKQRELDAKKINNIPMN